MFGFTQEDLDNREDKIESSEGAMSEAELTEIKQIVDDVGKNGQKGFFMVIKADVLDAKTIACSGAAKVTKYEQEGYS